MFGHAIFNPNEKDSHTAVVYLIGDSPDLAPLRQRALYSSEKLSPYLPSTSPGYRISRRVTGRRTPRSPTQVQSSSTTLG